jgi:hypothetical protein
MRLHPFFIIVGMLVISQGLFAQPKGAPGEMKPVTDLYEEKDEDFTYLFDGKTLDGWTEIHKFGPAYFVTNGVIASPPDAGNDLVTERSYSDFILRMDFKLTPGANNGVGIRTPFEKANLTYVGNEVQILDDDDPQYAHLDPGQYCGSLYKIFAAKRGALNKVGEWNHYEITALGRRIKVVLNDKTIVDGDINSVTDPETLWAHPGMLREAGHIALLGHSSHVEFRNIRIKELPHGTPPDNTPPEGFVPLFDGHDLDGWKGADKSWTAQGGALFNSISHGGAPGKLWSARDYGDFEMLIDWKTAGGGGGIALRGAGPVKIMDAAGSGGMKDLKPLKVADNPPGEWNRFRILAVGDKMHVFLNGQLVVRDGTLENILTPGKAVNSNGPIELQAWDPMWFKNIFIREIPRKAAP